MPPIRRATINHASSPYRGRMHLLDIDAAGRARVRMSGACRCLNNIQFTFQSSPCVEGGQQHLTISPLHVFRRTEIAGDNVVLGGLIIDVNHPVPWGNSVIQVLGINRQSGEDIRVPLSDPVLLVPGCKERISVSDELLTELLYSDGQCPISTTSALPVFELQWTWFGAKCAPKADQAGLARVGLPISGLGTVNYTRFRNSAITHLRTAGG